MGYKESWLDYAICNQHPALSPDAWWGMHLGYPENEGAQAAVVCRFSCPVAISCRMNYQGEDVVAGGGWWDRAGAFRQDRDDEIEMHQAAAYIGISMRIMQDLNRRHILAPVRKFQHRAYYSLADVRDVALTYGPVHGTLRAAQLHHMRGEHPCERCAPVVELLAPAV